MPARKIDAPRDHLGEAFSPRELRMIELAKDGLTPSEIAGVVGVVSYRDVSPVLSNARRAGLLPKDREWRRGQNKDPRIRVAPSVWTIFQLEAKKRDVDPGDLVRDILSAVAHDELFKAVLDK